MNPKLTSPKSRGAVPVSERTFCKARPLAARIGISAKTLFRWADAGLIHRHKVNARVVLFDEAEVDEFITRCRVA
jgi:predicted site-specific integrase-resolvase